VDGHGTHVCGIIAGQNIGIAPGAELLVASVIESETLRTTFDRVLIGLDWMLSHFQLEENQAKPTVINMSLGFPPEVLKQAAYKPALEALRKVLRILIEDFSVLPVVAIGNDGPGKMRAPGCFSEVLSVGAVGADLHPAPFSGGGISPTTGQTEPDVVGFGVDIVSSYERTMSNRSRYVRMSGTSMATPYVTGIAALYAASDPSLQGEALRSRIIAGALPLEWPADRVGAGLARYVSTV
jgi:subtilisin family serine protease